MMYAILVLQVERRKLNQEAIRIIKSNKSGLKGSAMTEENERAINLIDERVDSIDAAIELIREKRQVA